MPINPLSNMHDDIIEIISKSVIKYKYKEMQYETLEITKAADTYIDAMLEKDNFYTHLTYERELLLNPDVGIPNIKDNVPLLDMYMENRRNIPEEYHDKLLELKRKKIISEYEEQNDYYREMIGLPPIETGEKDFVYVDSDTCEKYGIDSSIPVHKLSTMTILLLEGNGIIDSLIAENSDKPYLKFLGDNKVDLITARRAKDYSLLRVPYIENRTMLERFTNIYDESREYIVSCIFVPELRNVIDYYDNFLAMIIMLHSITQLCARIIKTSLRREYYDTYCTKLLYSVYGVPYYDELNQDYQKAITQYLNILVLNKGTNTSLFDISSLLGYDRVKIYKYYLMKDRNIDSEGKPVFAYDEDGNYDLKSMYDVYFSKVALDDADFRTAIIDPRNRCEYDEITSGDPFWYEEDKALYEQLYESEYNYYESKYLGLSLSFRLSEVMFESVYLINMIFDKKDEMEDHIMVSIPKITNSTDEITLFDATVLLCAIICKYHGIKGNILYDPSKILHIMGFDFDNNWNILEQMIQNDKYLSQATEYDGTNKILNDLVPIECVSPEAINKVYDNHMDLLKYITEKLSSTQDINEYRAYRQLYETVYVKNENIKSFTINGYVPTTYLDYLKYANYKLYDIVMKADKSDLYKYIDHLISKLTSIFTNVDYIHVSTDDVSPVQKVLVSMIKFFKSYTTDLIRFDIIYVMNWKTELLLRLIDRVEHIYKTIIPKDKWFFSYSDNLRIHSRANVDEEIELVDKPRSRNKTVCMNDRMSLHDTCNIII